MQNQGRKLNSTQRRIFAGCTNSDSTRKEARLPEQHIGILKDLTNYRAEGVERKAQTNIYHFPSLYRKLNLLKVNVRQLLSSAITTELIQTPAQLPEQRLNSSISRSSHMENADSERMACGCC